MTFEPYSSAIGAPCHSTRCVRGFSATSLPHSRRRRSSIRVKALWGGELPEFDSLDKVNDLRWVRVEIPEKAREGLVRITLTRREELDGFVEGVFGKAKPRTSRANPSRPPCTFRVACDIRRPLRIQPILQLNIEGAGTKTAAVIGQSTWMSRVRVKPKAVRNALPHDARDDAEIAVVDFLVNGSRPA